MNSEIRQLEDDIIKLLNASTVCMEAKRLILRNTLNLVTEQANRCILQELEEQNNAESARCE